MPVTARKVGALQYARADEDLARLGFITKAGRDVGNRANGRVIPATLKADRPQCRKAMRDADPEAKPVTVLTPFHIQLSNLITHPHRDGFASVASDNQSRSHNRSN